MNFSKTAQIAISGTLFILVFFLTSAVDLSIITAIAFYSLLSRKSFLPLFAAAIILFVIDIILRQLDISIRFISDLSLDSYILFLAGVWLYLKSKREFNQLLTKFLVREKELFSKNMILSVIISMITVILIFPLAGNYFSLVLGYFLFSYLIKQFNGKIAISFALFFLALAAVFILTNMNKIAEDFGNFAYFFLVVGTLQEVVNFIKLKSQK